MAAPTFYGVEEFFQTLKPFAEQHGKNFVSWADAADSSQRAQMLHGKTGIEGHYDIAKALIALKPGLAFSKPDVKQVLWKVHESQVAAQALGWPERKSEIDQWHAETLNRIRNMTRAIGQGLLKSKGNKKKPYWVLKILDETEEIDCEAAAKADAPEAAPGGQVVSSSVCANYSDAIFSFDAELLLPVAEFPSGAKMPGLPIDVGDCKEAGYVIAAWPDGFTARMPKISIEQLERWTAKAHTCKGILWEAVHKVTKHALTVRQKVDHRLIVVLMEQQKQVCMIKAASFGSVTGGEKIPLPSDNPTLLKAVEFMGRVGEKYAAGEVERDGLKRLKDTMARSEGINLTAKLIEEAPQGQADKAKEEGPEQVGGKADERDEGLAGLVSALGWPVMKRPAARAPLALAPQAKKKKEEKKKEEKKEEKKKEENEEKQEEVEAGAQGAWQGWFVGPGDDYSSLSEAWVIAALQSS